MAEAGINIWEYPQRKETTHTPAKLATKPSVAKTLQSVKFRPYQICRLGRQQLLSRNTAQTHITHTLFTSVHITGQNTTENTCWCGRLVEKAPQNMCSLLPSLVQWKKCIFPSFSKILFLKILHSLKYQSLKFHSWRLNIL